MDHLIGELMLCFLGELQPEKAMQLLKDNPELQQETPLGDPWLICAAEKGLKDVCRFMVESGADINEKGSDFYALENAIRGEHLELAEWLLENNANPNLGRTLVIANRKENAVRFAELLIKHGVDVNQTFEIFGDANHCRTALDWCPKEATEFSETLRRAGALTFAELESHRQG